MIKPTEEKMDLIISKLQEGLQNIMYTIRNINTYSQLIKAVIIAKQFLLM